MVQSRYGPAVARLRWAGYSLNQAGQDVGLTDLMGLPEVTSGELT